MEEAPYLEVEGLQKSYGQGNARVNVLEGITTSMGRGEICVLLGPSGSGKSTFLNLIGGLEPADAGTVRVGGFEVSALSDCELVEYRRAELGFVFQFYNLIADLTVRENIEVCAHLVPDPLDIDELLEGLGLHDQRDKFPHEISGGQQQRCAIGRALVKAPGLLLCDEPTGALDYRTSIEILDLMERVNRRYACTTVIVTHNDAIRQMAHHLLRLRDGRLVDDERNERLVPARELVW